MRHSEFSNETSRALKLQTTLRPAHVLYQICMQMHTSAGLYYIQRCIRCNANSE